MNVEYEINKLKEEIESLKKLHPLLGKNLKESGKDQSGSFSSGAAAADDEKYQVEKDKGNPKDGATVINDIEVKAKVKSPNIIYPTRKVSLFFGIFLGLILSMVIFRGYEKIQHMRKHILLYSDKDYNGLRQAVYSWDLNLNDCYNLDEQRNNFAASIDPQGECICVYTDSDCTGTKLEISSDTEFQHDLNLRGFAKTISSIQNCNYIGTDKTMYGK